MENNQELISISKKISDHLWGAEAIQDITAYVHPDMRIESRVGEKQGFSDLMSIVKYWRQAFPDLEVSEGEWAVDQGTVTWVWSAKGTHKGEFMGVEPTNKRVNYVGKTIYVYDTDNRMNAYASELDVDGIVSQLT